MRPTVCSYAMGLPSHMCVMFSASKASERVSNRFCMVTTFQRLCARRRVVGLNCAASTAWRIFATSARITVEGFRFVITVEDNARITGFMQPCTARAGVISNIITGVYTCAGYSTATGVLCSHCFNAHKLPHCVKFWLG